MYSSIEESSRPEVIYKCYWPLLKLAEIAPIGIEAPALTLEIINEIDPVWINKLKELINTGKVEFIGSGYSQIIGPLVPAKVNDWNQKLGLEVYGKLLGVRPKVALVNEMAYSGGIVEHYINVGYEGLIMEWNNPRSAHPEWENEWRYYPQKAIGADGRKIPLIWADSIAFQKFQRYVHGEYELEEYVTFLKSHIGELNRSFPLYSNDVEIFDYRPGRYKTEADFETNSEWDRIFDHYSYLTQQGWCDFVFPSKILNNLSDEKAGNKLKLESPAHPIPVKKQEKYNINRWALTGRDDISINSNCYKIYKSFVENDNTNLNDWKELCYLWSSDFRTHITEKRWFDYKERLNSFLEKYDYNQKGINVKTNKKVKIKNDKKNFIIENNNYKVVLNKHKGITIQSLVLKNISEKPLFGTLVHGYYDDITLGADYFSGHAIVEETGNHKITDLGNTSPIIDEKNGTIVTNQKSGNYTFHQKTKFENDRLILEKHIETNSSEKAIIRPFNITFNPEAWDRDSLYIGTHNGGSTLEKFHLKEQNISHGDIYSSLISARHGFGNTEGIIIVGDKDRSITFECDMSSCALIPSIIFKEMDDSYFFRLQYSAREMDETLMVNSDEININCTLSVSIINKL